MDLYAVQDFIEGKGIVESQINIVLDQMANMNYVNVLKPVMVQPQMQQPQMQQPMMQQPMM